MYVLGKMVQLDESTRNIPLPWWHRAPLGFEDKTQVWVVITKPRARRPGDLIISVLEPHRLAEHVAVKCSKPDEPGVIEEALDGVGGWNVALAESLTVEGGAHHDVDLICESRPKEKLPESKINNLRAKLKEHFESAQVRRLRPLSSEIEWTRRGTVVHGWTEVHAGESWRSVFARQLAELKNGDAFDTNKLVLSVDTNSRVFRGVIPRKGALGVRIEHADEPKVLRQLTSALKSVDVNVLSMFLKRGGAAPDNAIMVAVCEPVEGSDGSGLEQNIRDAIKKLPQIVRADPVISHGRPAASVIYGHHPDELVARVPASLKARVLELKQKHPRDKRPIFVSRRFLKGERPQRYAKEIERVLTANDCCIVEAKPRPDVGGTTSFDEVSSAMWSSQGGIVLGAEPPDDNDLVFSLNLAHEYGFFHGQGKPLLLLIEAPSRVEQELERWTNIKGIVAPRFSREHAFDSGHEYSIQAAIVGWLSLFKD